MPRKKKRIRIRRRGSTRLGGRHVAVCNRVICAGLMERMGFNKGLKEMKELAKGLFREDHSRPRQATKIEA